MSRWKLLAKRKGFRPLAIDGNDVYGIIRDQIVRTDLGLREIEPLSRMPPVSSRIGFLSGFRIFDRILRLSPSTGLIHDGHLFVVRRSDIFRYDIERRCLLKEFTIPGGKRALKLSEAILETGKKIIIFGEYFDNPERGPVNIWGRYPDSGGWLKMATIPAGQIEHIHAVEQIRDAYWILAGDFEKSAGIWKSNDHLLSIKPTLRGLQRYRGAWIVSIHDRLFYATDTQMESNHIFEIYDQYTDEPKIRMRADLAGSSIYSARGVGCHYFSTTVEGGPPSGNFALDIIDIRRGPGILSRAAHIMSLEPDGKIEEIYSADKDFLPFRLAQFGTFTFPSGVFPSDLIIAYGIGLQGNDDTCLVLKKPCSD